MAVTRVPPIRPGSGLARRRRLHPRHRAFGKRRPRREIVPQCRPDVGVAVTRAGAETPDRARVSLTGRRGPRAKAELEVSHSGRAMAAHGARTGADRLRHRISGRSGKESGDARLSTRGRLRHSCDRPAHEPSVSGIGRFSNRRKKAPSEQNPNGAKRRARAGGHGVSAPPIS